MADYRYSNLTTEKITWETTKGNKIEVSVSLIQEETDYFGNGDWKPTPRGLNIRYSATVDGKEHNVMGCIMGTKNPKIHAIGKIGIVTENYDRILNAKTIIENHPSWMAKIAAAKKADKITIKYETNADVVKNAMTVSGQSY